MTNRWAPSLVAIALLAACTGNMTEPDAGGGTGGGVATGGGIASGGGTASGGGVATGGGIASGGGTATGGGIASGGGIATGGGIASGGGSATGGGGATGGGAQDAGSPDAGQTVVYPAPAGELASTKYEVRVVDAANTVRTAFVYFDPARQVSTPGNPGTADQAGRSFNWTTFETGVPVRVRVTRLSGAFNSVKLRPSRYGLTAQSLGNNTIEFTMQPGQKVSVEFDTDMMRCYYAMSDCVRDVLMVFADPLDVASPLQGYAANEIYRPQPGVTATDATISGVTAPVVSHLGNANNKRVVVFEPGVHVIGYWAVPSNVEHIHVMGGAIVYGALNVLPQGPEPMPDDYLTSGQFTLKSSFKLTGHGIISGAKIPWHMTQALGYCADDTCGWWKMVRLVRLNVANIDVADVTLANSPYWTLAFSNDADARTQGTIRGVKVLSQWAYNNDGLPTPTNGRIDDVFVQTNDDAIKVFNSGATIDNCVMWNFSNGASFQIGWFPHSTNGATVSNVDVIHGEWWWGNGDNSGLLSYGTAGGPGTITNLAFTNVNMEDKILRLIGLFHHSGQRITNLSFTNVNVDAWGNDIFNSGRHNWLAGTDGGVVDAVGFHGLRVAGQLVTQANSTAVGQFQISGAVTNVTFGP